MTVVLLLAVGAAVATPATAATTTGQVSCTWTPASSGVRVKDVGRPPTTAPNAGAAVLAIRTNRGAIKVRIDLAKVPCTAASFRHLAGKRFWDGTKCHRLVNEPEFGILQCGDPFAKGRGYRDTDGQGGPGYTLAEENLPAGTDNPYPAGSVAMANTGEPNSTGSQFFICAQDTRLPADYTLLGRIEKGLDIVRDVVEAGHDGAFAAQAGGGHPDRELAIRTLRVTRDATSR